MKKIIYLLAILSFAAGVIGQQDLILSEYSIGETWFDVQTTRSMQDRIYRFQDGTIGVVFNYTDNPNGSEDLGVGYNCLSENIWGPHPTQSITSADALNPSYTKFGENGEICVSEGDSGLFINYRSIKGVGDWEEFILQGPSWCKKLFSPQVATSGTENQTIHILALCKDTTLQLSYQENITSVLYSRTLDGGISWDPLLYNLELDPNSFGFSDMSLILAEPIEDVLAFVIGDYFTNLLLVKSIDGGNSWQQTIIWEHPYPFMEFGTTVTDTFWANTGSMDIILDAELNAHVVFALCHICSDVSTVWYNDPWGDGIVYWNEDMESFSNNINALSSYGHPDSELQEDYNLIGWTQDIYGTGTINFKPFGPENPAWYPTLGLSTMPTISITNSNAILVVWSSLTETYDNGSQNYKHLWARASPNGFANWGEFVMLTDDLIHMFDECVFPVISPQNDDHLHLIYQMDSRPGLNINTAWPDENSIVYMKVELYFPPPPPDITADFATTTSTVMEGATVDFTNLSTVNPPYQLNYNWIFEGGNPTSSNLTDPSVTYNTPGQYDVALTAYIGPSSDMIVFLNYITVLPQVGISNTENLMGISIYPNPTARTINIELPQEFVSVKIIDSFGNLILQTETHNSAGLYSIDVTNYDSGIYFLELTTESGYYIEKILISK